MIALAPIHEDIRKTLSKRSQAVSRDFGGEDPLKSQNTKDTFKSTFSKAIWVRMFSPVNSTVESIDTKKKDKKGNPIFQKVEGSRKGLKYSTIFGGEVLGAGNERPLGGFEQIYANRSGTEKGILETVKGGLKRPMAGIKDISVSYKGGLSAIREAQINWSCWSFQDLNRLSPHFMAHGKGVLIEWGWSSPVGDNLIISNEEDMTNGTAYSLLQNRVIENEGNYDAMAGVVSNWDWTLREDGGIDCTTTIVSRGVNMLNASLDNPGKPPDAGEDEEGPSMSLPEFMSAFRETLYTLSTKKGSWWEGVEDMKPLTPISAHDSWTPGDEGGTQPPGIFTPVMPGLLFAEKKTGPFVTWGWFEDNVLSRFLGKYDGTGKTTASFRSIEPKMTPDNSGKFEGRDGDDEDANKIPAVGIHEADFQPVVIRNHKHLYSPFRDRWILPGQYPAQNTSYEEVDVGKIPWWLGGFVAEFVIEGVANLLYTNWDEDLTRMVAQSVQGLQSQNFESFTVDKDNWNKGGYLRNILIHWELLEESFKEAKTTKEGVNAILNEINSDVDGFWNFQIVTDPYIEGNVKIIDVNRTAHTVSDLLDDRKKHESADGSDEFGNPGSKLFTFPSWGEKSMVKSQNLSAKLPSSMQVTAMYSGTSSPTSADSAAAEGDDPGNAVGGLHGESVDDSQKDTRMAWEGSRMVNENVLGEGVTVQEFAPYGSKNPYNLESDLKKDTTIPSGTRFGFNKGIDFKFVDWYTIFGWGKDPATEFTDEDDKKLEKDEADRLKDSTEEKAKKNAAKTKEARDHFYKVATDAGEWPGDGVKVTGFDPPLKSQYAHGFSLYDENGNMHSYPDDGIVFHEVMKDLIHGRVSGIPVEDRNKIDVLAPVELEITIDGCGGIIPGNAFHVDYIPEEYQKYCLFQVLSVDQAVGADSWNTTIKGQIRIDSNRRISDKLGVIEKKEDDLDAKNEAKQEAYNKQQLVKEANREAEEAAAADLAANPPDPPTEPGGTTSGT